ncbi:MULTISPECIES: RNA polymerase sigma factor [Pseudomonas]|uniref:RNA polymerase sigma factor n=1 Tax=Pseudomonas TaxID=286 RepID=UPI001FAF71AD|nr:MULTISPECIES: RNA polymerase sigma factor [Pseudomonas]
MEILDMESLQHLPLTAVSDDLQLLPCLLAGEQRAFREQVRQHQGAMRSVALAIVGQRYVDDVVQDAWLAIVHNLGGFQCRSSLKTWMLTITANAAKGCYVQNHREAGRFVRPAQAGEQRFAEEGDWAPPLEWHEDSPEALLCAEQLRGCLEQTLNSLPLLQRRVLFSRERQGHALEAIGGQLGISRSHVRVLLHRARLQLFAALKRHQVGAFDPVAGGHRRRGSTAIKAPTFRVF